MYESTVELSLPYCDSKEYLPVRVIKTRAEMEYNPTHTLARL